MALGGLCHGTQGTEAHSREFKLEAVRLAAVGDRPKAKMARELGVRVNQLRKWRLDFEEEERTARPSKS